jgi:hypothetical protein
MVHLLHVELKRDLGGERDEPHHLALLVGAEEVLPVKVPLEFPVVPEELVVASDLLADEALIVNLVKMVVEGREVVKPEVAELALAVARETAALPVASFHVLLQSLGSYAGEEGEVIPLVAVAQHAEGEAVLFVNVLEKRAQGAGGVVLEERRRLMEKVRFAL